MPMVRHRAWTGLAPTVASAVVVALAFPPARLRPLAWVGLVPLLVALRTGTMRRAAGLAIVWLVVFAALVGLWFPGAVSTYYDQQWWVGLAFFGGVTATMGAPYYVAFAFA